MIPAMLLLVYRDGTETDRPLCRVVMQFKGNFDTSALARLIVDKSIAYWYASSEEFTSEQLRDWEALRTSGLLPTPVRGGLSIYEFPQFYFVGAGDDMRPKSLPAFPALQRNLPA